MDIHQDGGRRLGVHQLHAAVKHILHRRLHGQVQRQLQRRAAIGGIAQPGVEGLFHPRRAHHLGRAHAFAAETGAAKDMRSDGAVRVKPHLARAEQQAGVADLMHQLHLFGGDFLLHPQELALAGEILLQPFGIEVGKDRRQLFGGSDRVDHLRRLGVKRMGDEVGRQYPPLAIDDIGPLGDDGGTGARADGFGGLARRQKAHLRRDDAEDGKESAAKEQQPPLGHGAGTVAHLFMAQADILALDHVGVLALGAGGQDAGQRAQRNTGHCAVPSARAAAAAVSIGLVIGGRTISG